MANESPEPDELIEGIYQTSGEQILPGEADRVFKPWHKPRKHFIRVNQWCALIRQLIEDLSMVEGDTLRYLGMPGERFP